jgi:hypothetical protein
MKWRASDVTTFQWTDTGGLKIVGKISQSDFYDSHENYV